MRNGMKENGIAVIGVVLIVIVLAFILLGGPTSNLDWEQTWVMPSSWDPLGHSQGTECDGTYLWWSSGNLIAKTYISNPDWNNPLAINIQPMTDGTNTEQINGIHLHENYIYTTGPIFLNVPYRCFVKWYDKNTLEFVGEQELFWEGKGSMQEGITFHDGYWWVVMLKSPWVCKYDTSWYYMGRVKLLGQPTEVQGHDWSGGQLWVTTTDGPIRIYDYDGKSFTLATTLPKPSQVYMAKV